MKHLPTWVSVTALLALPLASHAQNQELPARAIPAYSVPVPTTVSPQMQVVISKSGPSAAPRQMPTTNEGWNAYSNRDPNRRAKIEQLLARYGLAMREETIAGVHCYVISPQATAEENKGRLLMHLHGGAYTSGIGEAGVSEAIFVAGATGIKTVSVDYRMPPDNPYPTPVDDAFAVWRELSARNAPAKLGIFGTSAGGSLTLSVVQRAIAQHAPIPAAIMAGTPWSDLSETGDSYFTNRHLDAVVYQGGLSRSAEQYASGMDLKDARISPIYGSFAQFPPTLLLTGTRDLFLSNTVRVDRKLRDAGRESELIVYEALSHGRYLAGPDYPETKTALSDIDRFFKTHLGR